VTEFLQLPCVISVRWPQQQTKSRCDLPKAFSSDVRRLGAVVNMVNIKRCQEILGILSWRTIGIKCGKIFFTNFTRIVTLEIKYWHELRILLPVLLRGCVGASGA